MKRNYLLLLFVLVAVTLAWVLERQLFRKERSGAASTQGQYQRIVSLAPSITETLFALGLGERVVGVTRFCKYPPEALEKKEVGGYLDPNYEAIAALKPDLVILLPEHEKAREYLDELGLEYLTVHNRKVSEILGTVTAIGEACGVEHRARDLVSGLESRMNRVRELTGSLARPRVLVTVERLLGAGAPQDIYIAGKGTFYDALITLAGGANVCESGQIPYPLVSVEGLVHLRPEVIVELIPDLQAKGLTESAVIRDWDSVPGIDAVKTGRVYVLSGDYIAVPGPRFVELLESLARVIHPEIAWSAL